MPFSSVVASLNFITIRQIIELARNVKWKVKVAVVTNDDGEAPMEEDYRTVLRQQQFQQ